jgi:RNA polymerase sigma-70 factor (ECF subfamily)
MIEVPPTGRFPTTQWSRIACAGAAGTPEAQAAIADLCQHYWYPIYALIRRKGHGPDEALDLTQDYFARLIGKGLLAKVDSLKGRFRDILKVDCGYFLADRRDHERALKRGGGRKFIQISVDAAEVRYRVEPVDTSAITPDQLFDRAWAMDLLERAMARIAREYADAGRETEFESMRKVLAGGGGHAEIAAAMGRSVDAIESASRRLRRRFAAIIREQIAETLDHPTRDEIEDEVRALFVAIGR